MTDQPQSAGPSSGDLYTSGAYLEHNPEWHAEDSPWKAAQVFRILEKNNIRPARVAEIGCGAGQVLAELQQLMSGRAVEFCGYDVAQEAIQLANKVAGPGLQFQCADPLKESQQNPFDVLLVIDVVEHVPDYLDFVRRCRQKAEYTVWHIPLEIHLSSVLRNQLTRERYTVGHIHYFTRASALATLKDAGCEIVDWNFTAGALELFRIHPSLKRAIANVPRWVVSRLSTELAARCFGGYSLLALTR